MRKIAFALSAFAATGILSIFGILGVGGTGNAQAATQGCIYSVQHADGILC